MTCSRYNFRKAERLCSHKIINDLFEGKEVVKVRVYPFYLVCKKTPLPVAVPAQVLISVGKKHFKKAVTRNRIKRQIREIYRLHKHQLYKKLEGKNEQLALLLLFSGKEIFDYKTLNSRFEEAFRLLMDSI